jgi:hypothetical protein
MPVSLFGRGIVKGRINSRGSIPTVRFLNGIEEGSVLRLDWEDVLEAWLEIDIGAAASEIHGHGLLDEPVEAADEFDEDIFAIPIDETFTEPAYSDFATSGEPKYSPVQYGAYAAWFRGDETEPMPPMGAYGPEPLSVS